jgi:hypothetical protein
MHVMSCGASNSLLFCLYIAPCCQHRNQYETLDSLPMRYPYPILWPYSHQAHMYYISAVSFTDFIVIAVLLTYPLHATRNKSNYQELRRILQDEEYGKPMRPKFGILSISFSEGDRGVIVCKCFVPAVKFGSNSVVISIICYTALNSHSTSEYLSSCTLSPLKFQPFPSSMLSGNTSCLTAK